MKGITPNLVNISNNKIYNHFGQLKQTLPLAAKYIHMNENDCLNIKVLLCK